MFGYTICFPIQMFILYTFVDFYLVQAFLTRLSLRSNNSQFCKNQTNQQQIVFFNHFFSSSELYFLLSQVYRFHA